MHFEFGKTMGMMLGVAFWLPPISAPCQSAASTNAALAYNALMLDAIRASNTGPTASTRNLAILHTAIFDAVNSVDRTYQAYLMWFQHPSEVSMEAAASAAGRKIVEILYPSFATPAAALDAALLETLPPSASTTNGTALGQEVALATLASREADGSTTQVPYIPSMEPGQWLRTPPFYRPPLDPHWRYVRLFCLENVEPYVAPGPPALSSAEYAQSFHEVRTLGARESLVRTPEQTEIAVFWSDFSYTAMPPGHWHEIAATICRDRQWGLVESARLLALMSLVEADAAIVCWEGKYRHNFWRPITAIQRADEDGNMSTEMDSGWDALLPAPNFPEYPSGHSTFSKAGAQLLTHILGTDEVSFTARSDSLPGVTRPFASLAACADEVGQSRIYGGFHFQFANRDGKASGRKIADFVAANFLLPVSRLPLLRLESVAESGVLLRLHGLGGNLYTIETSPDFRSWTHLTDVTARSGGILIEDEYSPTIRFYRARAWALP